MDAILIETATNNSPVNVAAAAPQITANVSQAFTRSLHLPGKTMNARALAAGIRLWHVPARKAPRRLEASSASYRDQDHRQRRARESLAAVRHMTAVPLVSVNAGTCAADPQSRDSSRSRARDDASPSQDQPVVHPLRIGHRIGIRQNCVVTLCDRPKLHGARQRTRSGALSLTPSAKRNGPRSGTRTRSGTTSSAAGSPTPRSPRPGTRRSRRRRARP
jgi:hypothetical protein